jgi:hypothetical protein
MVVTLDVNMEKLRYALVGNGYILEEVERLTEGQLLTILRMRVERKIENEYLAGVRQGLYDLIKE